MSRRGGRTEGGKGRRWIRKVVLELRLMICALCRVKITTAAPHSQVHEGTLFTACPVLHIVAINTRAPPPNPASNALAQPGDYHIIPFARIASCQVIALQQTGDGSIANALPAIGPVDTKQLQKREAARIEQLKAEEDDRGKGVSREGQAIYDSFKRMYAILTF